MATTSTNTAPAKKGKTRTAGVLPPDPVEASRQIAAKIAQLERETAGEKDQDAEIDQEVRKANREITQLLNKVESPAEQVESVRDKYLALVADFKKLDREYQKLKKRADQYVKEREALRTDLSKSNTLKEKLAKMSRETVAEIKVLKASLEKMEVTEVRTRQQLHERLDKMVDDVYCVVQGSELGRQKLAPSESDKEFKSKFNSFVVQHELRELQYLSMLRTMHLVQLSQEARLERKSKAQELESSRTHQLSRQVSAISQTESELRSQLNIYVEKFRQVEETLNNSNDLFLTFRKEMEDMSKKTKRLEKENQTLGKKVDASSLTIQELTQERNRVDAHRRELEKRNSQLEAVCINAGLDIPAPPALSESAPSPDEPSPQQEQSQPPSSAASTPALGTETPADGSSPGQAGASEHPNGATNGSSTGIPFTPAAGNAAEPGADAWPANGEKENINGIRPITSKGTQTSSLAEAETREQHELSKVASQG